MEILIGIIWVIVILALALALALFANPPYNSDAGVSASRPFPDDAIPPHGRGPVGIGHQPDTGKPGADD